MVIGIGNTAEYGTSSGLDDGQAAGLLSAVSGCGLPVVEPGPIPDPVAAGLNAAINHAYRLWVRSQPQLILELWPRDGLDETQPRVLRLVEPAAMSGDLASVGSGDRDPSNKPPQSQTTNGHAPTLIFAGFTSGAEPRRTPDAHLPCAAPPATPNAGGSAPPPREGDGANHMRGARRPQKGA